MKLGGRSQLHSSGEVESKQSGNSANPTTLPIQASALPSRAGLGKSKASPNKGRQMSCAHRWGVLTLTKYLSLSTLALAIISTIGLNAYRSYTLANTLANAEQGSDISTTSTNATGPASISLSITSLPNATGSTCTDTSNPAKSVWLYQTVRELLPVDTP